MPGAVSADLATEGRSVERCGTLVGGEVGRVSRTAEKPCGWPKGRVVGRMVARVLSSWQNTLGDNRESHGVTVSQGGGVLCHIDLGIGWGYVACLSE